MISYEIAMGMSVIPVFLIVGDLNSGQVDRMARPAWVAGFLSPVSFFIFLVAAFAETNRLPFDMPESESELVGGYHTEYSSMKFALFFLGEYANMVASSAMMVTLFFGGWTFALPDRTASSVWGACCTSAFLWPSCSFSCWCYLGALDVAALSLRPAYGLWVGARFIPVALANIL
jgi:NADH:ubiquinone oxidoreductase subunit H